MDLKPYYNRYLLVAQSINEVRDEGMKSWQKCVSLFLNRKKAIISVGVNKSKTHPLLLTLDYERSKYFSMETFTKHGRGGNQTYPIHSELDGYIKLLNSGLEFDVLMVYRGDRCDLPSEPCCVCAKWLRRISKLTVCYLDDKGIYRQVSSDHLRGHYRNRRHDDLSS